MWLSDKREAVPNFVFADDLWQAGILLTAFLLKKKKGSTASLFLYFLKVVS
jgi:hypothetical protein